VPDLAEVVQQLIEREQRMQRELLGRAFEPLDRTFDLFEQSAEALREQAAALDRAGAALQQAAGLMKTQAELFHATVRALRQPSRRAETILGVAEPPPRQQKKR
jgi:hypothetical protein